ncbi:response regulator transcription factor [Actinomyces slackii]|uniref:response regulator transcription factor n=1 Tax=Actinomyces slackii TaxID=52774 RepID=UPI0039E9CE4C
MPQVTAAEQAVLDLLCEGYSNAEIAARLVVSEATVKTHVSHLMKKFSVSSRLKLVVAVHHAQDAAR